MSDSLGLSVGTTNLVATAAGRSTVIRRSVLTVYPDRPAEVGVPGENPNLDVPQPDSLVLTGFVERVGDPIPLVAADGSAHQAERVLAEALDAMARAAGGGSPVAIAVPSYWGPAAVGALRGALRTVPALAPGGVPAALVPDSAAALTALQAAPGLPTTGVVALLDFGGTGTSISLADAGAGFAPLGETARFAEFSGDGVDALLLNHVIAASATDADDPAGTAAVGSLARLRAECRLAKERLSTETSTSVSTQVPGLPTDVRVTRAELENLIDQPLSGTLLVLEDSLQRVGLSAASLAAVATVGGGAQIPLITQRLSERLRVPVITTPAPQTSVAAGAALVAERGLTSDATTMSGAADSPTGIAPAAWAAGTAGAAATESAADGAPSATFRALAWSQDDASGQEPVPYVGDDYTFEGTEARPAMAFDAEPDADYAEPAPLPWYKRPPILFGVAAAAALLAAGGLAVTLASTDGDTGPSSDTPTTGENGEPVAPPPPVTVTVTGSDGLPTTSVFTPPPPTTTTTSPASETTSTTSSTTETTTTTTQPTTTTTQPTTTTTRTTTTRPTTTRPTTTAPPPTTTAPPPEPEPEPEPDPVTPDAGGDVTTPLAAPPLSP